MLSPIRKQTKLNRAGRAKLINVEVSAILAEIMTQLLAKAGPDPLPWLSERAGLYHLAGGGFASRQEWAKAILQNDPDQTHQVVQRVLPARSVEFPTAAARPLFTALDCGKFEQTFAVRLPDWELALNLAMETG